ncbi:hypothetical protein B0H11DRAFT_2224552 [Mycena galericulata]|nr:hypothetical protein B0H11DRAFT_2224552 [Mycena galericulata]
MTRRARSPSPVHPEDATNAALAAQKRPRRQPGLTASNSGHLVPDAIRKRFAAGWKQHVPLYHLTDSYSSHDNTETAKELDDTYTLDGSRAVIAVSKSLPSEPELGLNFAEWFQGWGRLHYEHKQEEWALCVAYDTEVRRRSCTTALDPAVLHLTIWNGLEAKHIARVTVEKSSTSNHRYHPYLDDPASAAGDCSCIASEVAEFQPSQNSAAPERSMLEQGWHTVITYDPLIDSDDESQVEHVQLEYTGRLNVLSRLRGRPPTPEPASKDVSLGRLQQVQSWD